MKENLEKQKKPGRMGKIIATALYRYPPIGKSNLISTISKAVIQYQVINQNQLSFRGLPRGRFRGTMTL